MRDVGALAFRFNKNTNRENSRNDSNDDNTSNTCPACFLVHHQPRAREQHRSPPRTSHGLRKGQEETLTPRGGFGFRVQGLGFRVQGLGFT